MTYSESQSHDDCLHLADSPDNRDSGPESENGQLCLRCHGQNACLRQSLKHLMEDDDDEQSRPSRSRTSAL
jgi:hypothetical protein